MLRFYKKFNQKFVTLPKKGKKQELQKRVECQSTNLPDPKSHEISERFPMSSGCD